MSHESSQHPDNPFISEFPLEMGYAFSHVDFTDRVVAFIGAFLIFDIRRFYEMFRPGKVFLFTEHLEGTLPVTGQNIVILEQGCYQYVNAGEIDAIFFDSYYTMHEELPKVKKAFANTACAIFPYHIRNSEDIEEIINTYERLSKKFNIISGYGDFIPNFFNLSSGIVKSRNLFLIYSKKQSDLSFLFSNYAENIIESYVSYFIHCVIKSKRFTNIAYFGKSRRINTILGLSCANNFVSAKSMEMSQDDTVLYFTQKRYRFNLLVYDGRPKAALLLIARLVDSLNPGGHALLNLNLSKSEEFERQKRRLAFDLEKIMATVTADIVQWLEEETRVSYSVSSPPFPDCRDALVVTVTRRR